MATNSDFSDVDSALSPVDEDGLKPVLFTALQHHAWEQAYNHYEDLMALGTRRTPGDQYSRQNTWRRIQKHVEMLDKWVDVAIGLELEPDDYYEDPDPAYVNGLAAVLQDEGVVGPAEFQERMERLEDSCEQFYSEL